MKRRRLRRFLARAGLAAMLAVGMLVLWPRPPRTDRITEEDFRRVKEGMSRAEVRAILGPRAGCGKPACPVR
jgi:outer membrane protein assembly factor BamE (lipoprotein component of BamABCDE complex)